MDCRFLYAHDCSVAEEKVESKEPTSDRQAKHEALQLELLIAADRFQVPELVSHCCGELAPSLSVRNAAERLILADQCHLVCLKVCHGVKCCSRM